MIARALGVEFTVVDAGIVGPAVEHPNLVSRRIAGGTRNSLERPAMSATLCENALRAGREIGGEGDQEAAAIGEMGIGNTSSASLVAAKLLGLPVAGLVGRGTGVDDTGLTRKRRVLEAAAARTPAELGPDTALCEYGGFESVMLAGAVPGAAEAGKLVLVGLVAYLSPLAAILALAGLTAGHLLMRLYCEPRLDGYTGDTLGAVQQASEIGLYLGLAAWA